MSDVGRSNVLQLVRLRKSRRRGDRKAKEREGESESEKARRSSKVDKSQGIRGGIPGFTERYDLCSLRLPSIILRQI